MAETTRSGGDVSVGDLVQGVISDASKLIEQQFDLLRQEVRDEVDRAKVAALSMSAGAGMLAMAGLLSTQMLVHLVHRTTRLPLWSCYGLVGGALGAAGIQALNVAKQKAERIGDLPQTRQTLKEDANWIRERASSLTK